MAVKLFILALLLNGSVLATTWTPSEKTDPLTGGKVLAQDIGSYGSYIYDWPSKYHLIFWPLTDENWICFNPMNGYAAFHDDFEELTHEEIESLTNWLEKNYDPSAPPQTYKQKLAWLEKVYGQRQMNDAFWCQFYRLMAYVHEEEAGLSRSYVKKALPLLMRDDSNGLKRKEQLYLLGEYNRLMGNAGNSRAFLDKAAGISGDMHRPFVNRSVVILIASGCAILTIGLCVFFRRRRFAIYIGGGLILFLVVQSVFIFPEDRNPNESYNDYLDDLIAERIVLLDRSNNADGSRPQQFGTDEAASAPQSKPFSNETPDHELKPRSQ